MMKEKWEHQDWKKAAWKHLSLVQRESKYKNIKTGFKKLFATNTTLY